MRSAFLVLAIAACSGAGPAVRDPSATELEQCRLVASTACRCVWGCGIGARSSDNLDLYLVRTKDDGVTMRGRDDRFCVKQDCQLSFEVEHDCAKACPHQSATGCHFDDHDRCVGSP